MFTNVFVQRWAYHEFANSGKWPEQTMFVIDERDAASQSSINQKGHYQTDLMGLAVEVKDSGAESGQVGVLRFRRRRQDPQGPCRTATAGRATTRTPRSSIRSCSLSHAESGREKVRDVQRGARKGVSSVGMVPTRCLNRPIEKMFLCAQLWREIHAAHEGLKARVGTQSIPG